MVERIVDSKLSGRRQWRLKEIGSWVMVYTASVGAYGVGGLFVTVNIPLIHFINRHTAVVGCDIVASVEQMLRKSGYISNHDLFVRVYTSGLSALL